MILSLFRSKVFPYLVVVLITAICYIPVIDNGWVNWDDDHYVLENNVVQEFSGQNLLRLLHPDNRVMDTYMPLPLISFSIEYALVKDDPQLYHINNLLLHLINTALVLLLIFLLTSNIRAATFTALIFGIHPMHVESVAWITERKDLLMGLFFLASSIFYIKFLKDDNHRKTWFYLASLLFFVLSIFSKPQAASLPLVLLLFDWWYSRKFGWKVIFEKLPYFAIATAIGILSMMIVDTVPPNYDFFDRILFSSYALVIYLVKFIFPSGLSVVYDLPERVNGFYPAIIYVSLPISLAILAIPIYFIRKNKLLFFGFAFFMLTIGLALHFFKLTTSVIYERYTYIPYIGLTMIIAIGLEKLIKNKSHVVRKVSVGFLIFVILIFGFLTLNRVHVWQNSKTLWTDVINKKSDNYFGYSKRGLYYMSTGEWEKALKDFNICLELKPVFDEGLNNRGMTFNMLGNSDEAFHDFSKAIELNANFTPALVNMGIYQKEKENYSAAILYLNKALKLESDNPEFYIHRGVVFKSMEKYEEAILDYSTAIQIEPEVPSYYYNRGFVYCLKGNYKEGINDFSMAIQLKPDYALAWFDRSVAYYMLFDIENALKSATKALDLGYPVEEGYFRELNRKKVTDHSSKQN